MGVVNTYLSAVAVGALTAGVAAANVVAVPPDTAVSPEVALAAEITIPILDIQPSPGPITITRQIFLTLGAVPNRLFAELESTAGTEYDLPGLYTNFENKALTVGELVRDPGESIGLGLGRTTGGSGLWEVLGILGSSATDSGGSSFDLTGLTGGTEGIGAALGGTLSDSISDRELSFFDSGIASHFNTTLATGGGQLSFMPFDGFKAVGGGRLLSVGEDPEDLEGTGVDVKLGSLEFGVGGKGHLGGDAGLYLGSAQSTTSCGGQLAFASLGAPVVFDVHTGDSTNILSGDFLTNEVKVSVQDRQLSVTGAIGGTVKIGSVEIGEPIDIDFQIPRASSMMLANNQRQGTVRDSLRAIPRNLGSDNETGGRHRAPLREAISDVKTAVNNAVRGKPAKEEAAP
jgi:hypothetical protein